VGEERNWKRSESLILEHEGSPSWTLEKNSYTPHQLANEISIRGSWPGS